MTKKERSLRYTSNDAALSKYILKLSTTNTKIPYMTKISQDTGISPATISRFAKRRGYYSFAEMRAKFNKQLGGKVYNDEGLIEFFMSAEGIVLASSKATEAIVYWIRSRLNDLKIPCRIWKDKGQVEAHESVFAISLSGHSKQLQDFMEKNDHKEMVVLTNNIRLFNTDNVTKILLDRFKYSQNDKYSKSRAIVEIFNWIDDILNVVYIQKAGEENKA